MIESAIIMENIGVENTGIDGALINRVAAGGKDGILSGYGGECALIHLSGRLVRIYEGQMIVSGFRVVLTEGITFQSPIPESSGWQYLVGELYKGKKDGEAIFQFDMHIQSKPASRQDNLFSEDGHLYYVTIGKWWCDKYGEVSLVQRVMPFLGSAGRLPEVSDADEGKVLIVNDSQWKARNIDESLQSSRAFSEVRQELDSLRYALSGSAIKTVTESGVSYDRVLPTNASPYVSVKKIGGITRADFGERTMTQFTPMNLTVLGANLLQYPYLPYSNEYSPHMSVRDNGDGTITFNGYTLEHGLNYHLRGSNRDGVSNDPNPLILPPGNYYISSYQSTPSIQLYFKRSSSRWNKEGVVTVSDTDEFFDIGYDVYVYIPPHTTISNFTLYPYLIRGTSPATTYPKYAVSQISLDFMRNIEGWGLGIEYDSLFNYIDLETGEYIKNVDIRDYEEGDETRYPEIITDGTRTVYPLFSPKSISIPGMPSDLFKMVPGGSFRVDTNPRGPAFLEIEYDVKLWEGL